MLPIVQFLLAVFLLIFFALTGLRQARRHMGDMGMQYADRILALALFFAVALVFFVVDYWLS